MILLKDFREAIFDIESDVYERSGDVVHAAMVSFAAAHDRTDVTVNDIEAFCETSTSMRSLRGRLKRELSELHNDLGLG